MPTRSELAAAYRATTYRVFLPGGALDLRLDQASPELSAWLADNEIARWVVVTAWNPGSECLSDQQNVARQSALEVRLLEQGFEPFAGENLADAGDWPAEDTCFVAGMACDRGRELAQEFGQAAIVCGDGTGVPRLMWTDGGDND